MQAAAFQLNGPAVDPQASAGIRGDRPDAEEHAAFVDCGLGIGFEMRAELSQIPDPDLHPIQVRLFRIPETRVFHREADPRGPEGSPVHLNHLLCSGDGLTGFLLRQDRFRLHQPVQAAGVPDFRPNLQESQSVRNLPGQGKDPVRREMHLRPVQEPDAPIQPGTGIPAGIGLHAGVYVDRDPVFRPVFHQAGQIHEKRRVSVMLQGGFAAVDFHGGVHHRPVNLQPDTAVLPFPGDGHILCVVSQAAGKVSHVRLSRRIGRDRRPDHAVVGQVHRDSRIRFQLTDRIQQAFPVRPLLIQTKTFHPVSLRSVILSSLFSLISERSDSAIS